MKNTKVRCAIYTRKSSEEGLEQSFNSLDAQREACEAYIRSQKHEGWTALPNAYDDGGFSGGTLDRPALKCLLADIDAGRVDVVVVYKVDRLTRSLADFAKIVETFDGHGVSFVSVTQQFNTTSSMGRLTLNVLLSFAQFEREVTGERIRDKIAASKAKGMWMGGTTPLGYRVIDRTLVINTEEAATVRSLFTTHLECRSVYRLRAIATEKGWVTQTGRSFLNGQLYNLLQNPIYIGKIRHKEAVYDGQHAPIIDQGVWEAVQAILAENRIQRRVSGRGSDPSLLVGKLFDEAGRPFNTDHSAKGSRRYRYYVERLPYSDVTTGGRARPRRFPAIEIEKALTESILGLLRSPRELVGAVSEGGDSAIESRVVPEAGAALAGRVAANPVEQFSTLRTVIARAILGERSLRIELDRSALRTVLNLPPATFDTPHFSLTVPTAIKAVGNEVRLAIDAPPGEQTPEYDNSLLRVVVQGNDWWRQLRSGEVSSVIELAQAEGVAPTYVSRLIDLAFLAPDITTAILDGRQPIGLTSKHLARVRIPEVWDAQRRLFGSERSETS